MRSTCALMVINLLLLVCFPIGVVIARFGEALTFHKTVDLTEYNTLWIVEFVYLKMIDYLAILLNYHDAILFENHPLL